ncbi:sensor domain-containing diguanylate cyclase [Dokdonella immobilis]|uniref:diguanylate cyclase n=1 Tax=Dokdonella immobilis TaxID=578942 RepID=A0A1I4XX86_9GAMM|nr:GGDEF domain-containing protein [Dokdonella immobilis]SFN30508.1 diguanylate cyclase (GGDEF) domain-containing protein [Dokdonella immobilis]
MNGHGATLSGAASAWNRRYSQRLVASFLVLAVILAAVAVQVYRAVGEFVATNHWVTHSLEVKQEITLTLASLHDIEASQRAYIISGKVERLEDYYRDFPRASEHSERLAALVADDPQQAETAARLHDLIQQRIDGINAVLTQYAKGGIEAVRTSLQVARSLEEDHRIDALGKTMLRNEEALLAQREKRMEEKAGLTTLLTTGAVLVCLLILSLALVALLREERRRLISDARVKSANVELTTSLNKSQDLARTLRQLSELGEMLQGCRSIEEATDSLRISLPHLLPGSSGSISLINASKNLLEPIATWGSGIAAESGVFSPNDCWALRRGHVHPASGTLPSFTCRHLHSDSDEGAHGSHCRLCVPMVAQGEMLGVLTVSDDAEISTEVREIAIAASEQISLAMANLRLQETLRTQSLRDALTGLFNRRYLEASFEREIQRAERRQLPLSVLMLDVDHFKRFNDTHGHEAGDTLLAQFGALLARTVRSEDVSCRYGGEEFTILMPEADSEQALQRAEEICSAVRNLDVQHRNLSLGQVTVSIGVATYGEHGKSAEELMRNADNALYLAKNSGRDQAMLAEVLHPKSESKTPLSLASVSRLGSTSKVG